MARGYRGGSAGLKRAPLSTACALLLAAGLLMTACGGGLAPVEERSSGTRATASATGANRASAGSEAVDTDWTAKVRPLGDTGGTASRPLPSPVPVPQPAPAPSAQSAPAAAAVAPATQPSPRSMPAPAPRAAPAGPVNPAVVSLLNTASAQSGAGDYPRAAATLERAIAIEPDNAWLWHRLADTRSREGRLDQAAQLAAKSNSLTEDRALQADNWRLIAEVRRRQGDLGGAAAAESQAAALEN